MDTTVNITIFIDERPFSLKVREDEEMLIRNAADEVNERINEFRQLYKQKDKKDLLSAVLLLFAVENIKIQTTQSPKAVEYRLDSLNELLDVALEER